MRLICGFVHLDDQPVEAARLDVMVAAMIEPGLAPRIARRIDGAAALAVLDFAAGPAIDLPRADNGLTVAADIRLHEPGAGADDARLLAALGRHGAAGIGALLGDFAFAAWNPQSRTLLCARDALGIRPFFFAHRPGRFFVFASLPRGLFASGLVERVLDEEYLLGDLLARHHGPERSLFRGVERLAPGGLVRVSARGIEHDRHWRLDAATAGSRVCRPEEAAEELRALITEAVRCRLPAAGPVAAHLSGGLDSASVAILAARMLRGQGRPLLGYSLLPTPQGDFAPDGERQFIEAVRRKEPDIVWTPIRYPDATAFVLPRLDSDQVMPCDPTDPEVQIFTDAAAQGAETVFSGWGGDEGASYNGRGALAEALLAGRWRALAEEVRAFAAVEGVPVSLVLRGELLPYLLPEPVWSLVRRLAGRAPRTFILAIAALLRRPALAGLPAVVARMGSNAAANRLRLLTEPILPRRTEQWALTGARHGIAAAFPLLDRRVVAFALSLPSALFLRGGWRRRLYRDAMATVLPPEILECRHKLNPHPEVPVMIATQRDEMLNQLPGLRAHPRVGELFDLDAIERGLCALPPADEVLRCAESWLKSPAVGQVMCLRRTMRAAVYVQQHHGAG